MSVQYEPKHTEQCRISTEDHKCTCGLEAYLQDVAKGKEAVETMGQIKRLAELHLEGSLMMLALADPDMTKKAMVEFNAAWKARGYFKNHGN